MRAQSESATWTRLLGLLLVGSASLVFALAPANGDTLRPIISLGQATVQDGAVTVSATVPASVASVAINGQPVAIANGGQVQATVNLNGQNVLQISATNPATGERSTITIPLTSGIVGPEGRIGAEVLVSLQQAGISVVVPPDGFQIIDGQPLRVTGRVLDSSQLASLQINGSDALLKLGRDGSFAAPASGSSKEVVFTATDKQGVSQTSTFPVTAVSSLIRTGAGASVTALGAKGLRIAKVRYLTTGVRASKRIRTVITVKDLRGYLVRDAIVQVRSLRAGRVRGGAQYKLSGRRGNATFTLQLVPNAFGKRLFTVTTARTPRAQAKKVTSVAVPRLAKRKR